MNNEMAGKITSAVSGLEENAEAQAKELNATITIAALASILQSKGSI